MAQRDLLPPSWDHPFGTDKLGRDVASRVIYGARVSLIVGVVAVAIMVVIGLDPGGPRRLLRGLWDSHHHANGRRVLRLSLHTCSPSRSSPCWGRGFQNVFIAIGILGWPSIARVFRSSILSVKENEYVDAARAMGASTRAS